MFRQYNMAAVGPFSLLYVAVILNLWPLMETTDHFYSNGNHRPFLQLSKGYFYRFYFAGFFWAESIQVLAKKMQDKALLVF